MTTATVTPRGCDFRSLDFGNWEEVDFIDQNPRPDGHEGKWGNGITVYHVVGAQSGLIAIQYHQMGGFETWYTPDGTEIDWCDTPQFHRSTVEKMLSDERVNSVVMFDGSN
jgi:hypothetical protein